jgi:hypothetical protein
MSPPFFISFFLYAFPPFFSPEKGLRIIGAQLLMSLKVFWVLQKKKKS